MVRWHPPPADDQNGEITAYKIRYRKGARKSEASEIVAGTQLHKLLDSKLSVIYVPVINWKQELKWNKLFNNICNTYFLILYTDLAQR